MFEKAFETVEKMGIELGDCLGRGAFARVYAIKGDDTRVVKITGDEDDAYVAELARRAQLEGKCSNLVRVYRVLACKEDTSTSIWHNNTTSYIVISERLQRIPDEAGLYMPNCESDIDYRAQDLMKAADLAAEGDARGNDYRKPVSVWGVAACNIKGMVDDLRSLGVKSWSDFKLTNVMLRPGDRIVVTDFGCTESPIPELEHAAA